MTLVIPPEPSPWRAAIRAIEMLRLAARRSTGYLADGRELSIQAVGKPPAGRILAGDGRRESLCEKTAGLGPGDS